MKKYAFGVDIGGTTCKIGFFETSGTLIDKWEIHTDTTNGGENILPNVALAIDNKLAQRRRNQWKFSILKAGLPKTYLLIQK